MTLALFAACDADEDAAPYAGPPIPWAYAPLPAIVTPIDNPSTPAKIELGRVLFYDPILSGDQATACATCHSEVWGMSDGLALSIGVDGEGPTGPGRLGPNVTPRNSPTIWNVAYRSSFFWDGRSPSLEDQALRPLENDIELAIDPAEAAERLAAIPEYVELFERAFPADAEPVTPENLARAIATFERTFLSIRAPYDRYVEGDVGALSTDAQRGMELFAEAGCPTCHAPPLFESPLFAARMESSDPGRGGITAAPSDLFAFRVPTLRNIRESGPYFHDGSIATLEEAVALESARSAAEGEGRELSADEMALVTVFLNKGLTDRTREPERPREVPSGLPVPVDGFRVPR